MIISNSHNYIFCRVPKVASVATASALMKTLEKGDKAYVGYVKRYAIYGEHEVISEHDCPSLIPNNMHVPLRDMGAVCDIAPYTKFAVVRNPYDRFVSAALYSIAGYGRFIEGQDVQRVRKLLHWITEPHMFNSRYMWKKNISIRTQAHMLVDAEGKLLTDFLGRYETLQEDFDEFSIKVGLPRVELLLENKSRIPKLDYREYYDTALIDKVAALYKTDLELFNYEFE